MPPSVNNTKYYDDLELPSTASEAQIKAAYRRLALQFHPDKTRSNPERFPQIGRAYEILGKPKTKRIYDSYGELGITVFEKTGSAGLTEFLLNSHLQGWLILLVLVVVLVILSFPFLVAYKLNGTLASWSWSLIATPIWFTDFLILASLLTFSTIFYRSSTNTPQASSDEDSSPIFTRAQIIYSTLVFVLFFGLLISSQILTALKLDSVLPNISWIIVLTPYLIFECIHMVFKVLDLVKIKKAWPGDDPILELTRNAFAYTVYCSFRWAIPRTLTAILFILKTELWTSLTWTLVLCPAYVALIIAPVADLLYDRSYQEAIFLHGGRALPTIAIHAKFILSLTFASILCTFLGLLNYKLLVHHSTITWVLVFLPLLIVVGGVAALITCCVPVLWCCFLGTKSVVEEEDLANMENGTGRPPTRMSGRLSAVNFYRYGLGLAPIQNK